jgi:drug/metabolite transporter (DMT)-like permease
MGCSYLTHGSWSLLWPTQLLILRLQKWKMPWKTFWRRHVYLVRTTAQMVETQDLQFSRTQHSPIPYMLRMTAFVTCALTVAGGSWYVAVDLTSPSDLTAIYNCSAFFAYAFSVPLLKEKLRLDKSFAVLVAIIGVLVVAYGDSAPTKHGGKSGGSVGGKPEDGTEAKNRALGNIIIGVGSVLYGFYEVLYKKLACPPEGTSPGRGMIFANTFGSLIGSFTLLVLWIPLPILHVTGIEKFELPHGEAARLLVVSVLANAVFSGSFLVLISLTSPVLSSVAALLTIFIVAIVDWMLTGVPLSAAAIAGGVLIVGAFGLLSYSTFKELQEEQKKKDIDLSDSDSDKDSD